jgi:hypothetical protein
MLSQASRVTGLGLAVLLGAALAFPACNSGGEDPDGNAGSGASSAGTAGSGAGTAGSGGSGGSGGGQSITQCPGVMPPNAAITDFAMTPAAGGKFEWGSAAQGDMDFWGGTFNYPDAVTLTVADGTLTAAGNVEEFAGFGLYVQNCADASSFDGVRFTISGNPPLGKMRFAVQTNENEWATGMKGSCLAAEDKKFIDCVHPSVEIDVTDEPTMVSVTWAQLGAGKPAASATTDGADIIGLQWILPWTASTTPYDVSVELDDLEFIAEGSGSGGAGSGGAPSEAGAGGAP